MTDPTRIHDHPHPAASPPTTPHGQAAPDTDADERGTAEERRASEFVTHGDPTLTPDTSAAASRAGVQWVRPTDAAARAGAVIVDRGSEWNRRLHDAVLDGIREGRAQLREQLARRQEHLDPDSSPTVTPQRPVGRTVVSR